MLNFNAPLSALRANVVALDVVAHNLANMNTEGYSRQVVNFVERPEVSTFGLPIGQGVSVADIRSVFDTYTERAINQNTSDAAAIDAQLQAVAEIEALLAPAPGSISNRLEEFFNQLELLTGNANESGAQTVVVQSASALAAEINSVVDQLRAMVRKIDQQIQSSLDNVGDLSGQLVELSSKIAIAEAHGNAPVGLINDRNRLLTALSREIDVEMRNNPSADRAGISDISFHLAEGRISFANSQAKLFAVAQGEKLVIRRAGSIGEIDISRGRLGGLLHIRNTTIPGYIQRIESLASALVSVVDAQHAEGVGAEGSFTSLISNRHVDSIDEPLADNDTFVPVQAGSLFITVTDIADDSRSLHEVVIDPSQTLEEIAGSISSIDHLQAVVDPNSGGIAFLAEPGFTFDFTGGVPTAGTSTSISGTAEIMLSGTYTGGANRELEFLFVGSGTVGLTDGITLEVRDEVGSLLGTFNVGNGYEEGSHIDIGDGIILEIASGTVTDGDTFTSVAIAESDNTGFLVALGINTLFSGRNAGNLRISDTILKDPRSFAISRSGQALDTRNAQAMLWLRDQGYLVDGEQTFEGFLAKAIATVGAEVSGLSQFRDRFEVINESLQAQRQAVSGVDETEEIVRLLQYQRAFQSAARYVSVLDETLQELFNILR